LGEEVTMSAPSPTSEELKPKSVPGLVACSIVAAFIYPLLFVLGWITASPIYEKKEAVALFVELRDGSYFLFSGHLFKAMVLHSPNPDPDAKKLKAQQGARANDRGCHAACYTGF
jgi:hypothetical protein